MRIHGAVLAKGRSPQNPEKVLYEGHGHLKLKDKVVGKNDNLSTAICLHELSLIFSCFKKNNFKEELCSKELFNFQKCFNAAKSSEMGFKNTKTSLSKDEANRLLNRFPNK